MLAVLQVIGQFLVVGLLGMLLRRFALKAKQQKGLFDVGRWAWFIFILQLTTGGSARLFSISSSEEEEEVNLEDVKVKMVLPDSGRTDRQTDREQDTDIQRAR